MKRGLIILAVLLFAVGPLLQAVLTIKFWNLSPNNTETYCKQCGLLWRRASGPADHYQLFYNKNPQLIHFKDCVCGTQANRIHSMSCGIFMEPYPTLFWMSYVTTYLFVMVVAFMMIRSYLVRFRRRKPPST